MPLPISRSQLDKLGRRLVADSVSAEDEQLLNDVLLAYDAALSDAVDLVEPITDAFPEPLNLTARLKTAGTIRDKLRRFQGQGLKSIHDLAGMRIVGDMTLLEQDTLGELLRAIFSDCPRAPIRVDRRTDPRCGYRAIHMVVFPDGMPVEIQIRTESQHRWAEMYEKLADLVGREIRYTEDLSFLTDAVERDAVSRARALGGDVHELDAMMTLIRHNVQATAWAADTGHEFPDITPDAADALKAQIAEIRALLRRLYDTIQQLVNDADEGT